MKSFANALNTNAATFSLSLREPRHWFDSSVTVRRNYYAIFLWLNLPPRERRASFKRPVDSDGSDDENPRFVKTPLFTKLKDILVGRIASIQRKARLVCFAN